MDRGNANWGSIRKICNSSQLNCDFLLMKTRASGDDLYWANSNQIVEGAKDNPALKKLYYHISNVTKANAAFNEKPWVIFDFPEESSEVKHLDMVFPYAASTTHFPTYSNGRALCEFTISHPMGRASNMILEFAKDIRENVATDLKSFKGMASHLGKVVKAFNQQQTAQFGEVDESCEELDLPIADVQDISQGIEKKLGVSPSQLVKLVGNIKRVLQPKLRNLYASDPTALRKKAFSFEADVKVIERMLPQVLSTGERLYEKLWEVLKGVPREPGHLTLTDAGQNFGDPEEAQTIKSMGALGAVSIALNGLLALGVRHLRRRMGAPTNTQEQEGGQGCMSNCSGLGCCRPAQQAIRTSQASTRPGTPALTRRNSTSDIANRSTSDMTNRRRLDNRTLSNSLEFVQNLGVPELLSRASKLLNKQGNSRFNLNRTQEGTELALLPSAPRRSSNPPAYSGFQYPY